MNRLNIGNKVNSSRFRKGKTDTSSFLTAEDWNAAIKAINDCIDAINNLPEHLPQQESSTNNKIDELESNLTGLNTRLLGVEASLRNLTPIQTGDNEISIAENDPIFTAWANGAFKNFFKFNGSSPENISSLNFGNGFVVNTTANTTTVSVDPSMIPSSSSANPADIALLSSRIDTLTNNVNTLSNNVNTLSGRVSALETATPSTDNTLHDGETPSTGGDSGTQPGNDNPPSGGDSTGGDTGGSGSGTGDSEQGHTGESLTTTYGHWEYTQDINAAQPVWTTATELEYYGADASKYLVKFVPATGIENLTVSYFGWDPSLAENEHTIANRQNIGSDSALAIGLINHVTVNVSTGVVTLPDSTINNSSSNVETMETITIGANVKVNDVTQGDPILFDIKVKRKKVSFRFTSSTGYVSDSAVVSDMEVEMPDIQIQKGTGAEWINIEDDTSDYFKGDIRISRPVTDTTVIRLNNEVENNVNTSYSVTIPYNDAKNPSFWSNLINVVSSGQCVLSMSWGPYDQYTFASTLSVTVTSEYSTAAPTPPSNDDMY